MQIRRYQSDDLQPLMDLFFESVHRLAKKDYDAKQLNEWAPPVNDSAKWQQRLSRLEVLVASQCHERAGFIAYEMSGYIDLLYVSPRFFGSGVAFALYREAERNLAAQGVAELFTESSLTAKRFFERQGFR